MSKLIWRNLMRNKRRTFLTVASVALALFLLSLLGVVLDAMSESETTASNRLVVRNAISLTFDLPEAYGQRLATVGGVQAVTPQDWFGGTYKDSRPQNFFPRFGVNPDNYFDVFPEVELGGAELAAWRAERTAAIAGQALAAAQGWQLGERINIVGDIYPMTLELTLRGIYNNPGNPSAERMLLFHRRYVEEAMGNPGSVGVFWVRLDNPERVAGAGRAIEAMFENSSDQVRAETEEAFRLSFMQMQGNVRTFIGAIGLAIVISIFLITANTMAMAARERTTEVAVLRTLGFRRGQVVSVVLAEALAVGAIGALLGILLAVGLLGALATVLAQFFFGPMTVSTAGVGRALAIGLGLGLLSGLFPAIAGARLKIVDGLRKIG